MVFAGKALKLFLFLWTTSHIVLNGTNAHQVSYGDTVIPDSSYFFYQQAEYPRDCEEIRAQCSSGNFSGVYYIKPEGYPEPFEVCCDITDGLSGWTIVQRRSADGIVSFGRGWEDFKNGFGFLSQEFWIGNERLSYLTNQKNYQLSIEMTLFNGSMVHLSYNNFRIGDEFSEYKLIEVAQFSGITDSITWITCPNNMVYDLCTCGLRSCREPTICLNACVAEEIHGCICPEGYYMNGDDCIPEGECGCYVPEEEIVLTDGETFVNDNCTRIAICSNNTLTRNGEYECSPNGECGERDDMRGCYCDEGYSGDGETCTINKDCMDVYNSGSTSSGTYTIDPTNWPGDPFSVYCNMTDGGGWTVVQRRIDGDVDFYRDWASYKTGFGDVEDEHWLGNEKLYYLTNQKDYQLRVDLVNKFGSPYYAKFTAFRINDESDNYRLSVVGTYSGTASDALAYHRNYQFSTKDRDNDGWSNNCAVNRQGAWWYNACAYSNLNGDYDGVNDASIEWETIPGGSIFNVKYTEMKIRPA